MKQSGNIVQKLAVLYLIVWTIAPPLQIDMIYRLFALGSAGIWAIIALQRGYYLKKIHIYACIFLVFVIAIAYIQTGSFDGILQQISIYILVISFLIHCFYEKEKWHELSWIVSVILILLTIFNYKTFQLLIEDHTMARQLVRADESVYQYLRQGIGGYSLIYPQVCIFPAILSWIIYAFKKNKLCFLIGCVWLYTYVEFLMNAGYSIAIFASCVGVFMLFFYGRKNIFVAVFVSAILFVFMLWAVMTMEGLQNWLLQTFDGTAVAIKVQDLISTGESGAAEGSISERINAYMGSVEVILDYPVMGSLWNRSGGGHSAILDIIAKYGIWGGAIYCIMIFYVPHRYKTGTEKKTIWRISNGVMVSTLFVGVLDSFNYSFMCMLVLVLPLLYEDIMRWEEIRYESAVDSQFNTD